MQQKQLIKAMSKWLGLGTLIIQAAHAGNTISVNSIQDQAEVGLTTLREAIEQANNDPGSTIIFDETLFSSPQIITLQNGDLSVFSDMTLTGPGADLLTIDGDNLRRILTIDKFLNTSRNVELNFGDPEDIQVTVSGITFTKGNGESTTNNSRGGCILAFDNLILVDSVVTGCTTDRQGGGIYSRSDALTIENSTISNNIASSKGGGVYRKSGSSEILNSTITGNNAGEGGGVYLTQAGATFLNSTISNNQANQGAGIRLESGSPRTIIKNATVVNNIGTGIDLRNTEMHNTIVAGNSGGDCLFLISGSDNQNNLDTDGSCDVEAINHITVADPLLEPLANFGGVTATHRPLPGSPVIDRGDDFLCTDLDQRGVNRPQDGDSDNNPVCDIGAVELAETEDIPQEIIYKDGFDLFNCGDFVTGNNETNRGCR